jgi:hypothetical protein
MERLFRLKVKKMLRNVPAILFLVIIPLLLATGFSGKKDIRYFHEPLINLPPESVMAIPVAFQDSLGDDTLYQRLSAHGLPVSYHRKIRTSVCFDGLCRLLDIIIYWNPTGSYLGFELPDGEFLSKAEHDPFTEQEYQKLHGILSDSLSPLGDYSFAELVAGGENAEGVDAVSSATLTEIQDYVIAGAAYTTYRLWHIYYGITQAKINELTRKSFSEELALEILRGKSIADQIWVLNNLPAIPVYSEQLSSVIFDFISHPNLNLAERSLNALNKQAVETEANQKKLLDLFINGEYALKKSVLNKLKLADKPHPTVVMTLAEILPSMNGDIIGSVLDFYTEKGINEENILLKTSVLLENENRFISKKAYDFLVKVNSDHAEIKRKMLEYRNRTR